MGFKSEALYKLPFVQTHNPSTSPMARRRITAMGCMGIGQFDHNGSAEILSLCNRGRRHGIARTTFY
jgi:hypothetical protein